MDAQCTRGRGFTLIELMIAVAVVAVLASVGIPSFVNLIADQRAKSAASNLHTAMSVARSEAIKHNANVTLQPKSGNWTNGWVVLDPDGGANLLDANAAGVPITGGPATVVYNAGGRLASSITTAPAFTIGEAGKSQRCLTIDLSGRPTVKASAC